MSAITDNLGYWSREAADADPDKVALIDLSGVAERTLTYGELDARLDRMAAWTRSAGLVPGDRLAMVVGNNAAFIEAKFGAMRAGVVPVPVNTRLGPDLLRHILADAGCRAVIAEPAVNPHVLGVVDGGFAAAVGDRRLILGAMAPGWRDYETALAAQPGGFTPPVLPADHPAFQPYTSGSTGRPKGVVLTHAGQLWWLRTRQRYYPTDRSARALVAVPLYHKNAMAGAVKPVLHAGGSLVLLPGFEPRRFLEVLSEFRCTQTGGVPTVFAMLLQQRDLLASLDFSALRGLSIGSAPVPESLLEAVHATFGVPIREGYGLTEGGPVMFGAPLDGRSVPFGSCGVPWPEGEVKLVDAEGRTQESDGELHVRNPGVTPGYHNLPAVNAEKLRDGWLATGDLFHRDAQGFYYFRGRVDDMFKCGGETVYPKAVESLLIGHPAVCDACVVPLPDPLKGAVPVAMVLRQPGAALDAETVKAHALGNGPAYAHPRRVMVVDAMPLGGAGKVDRREVAAILADAFAEDLRAARAAPKEAADG
ncbi:MAG: class I adenylate-forming enzyme family protein [Azospirillaceae bacterium]